MKRSRRAVSLSGVALTVLLVWSGPRPQAQYGNGLGKIIAESLRQNTVRIETRLGDATENGFGFVVGEKEGILYAVTAFHVVSMQDVVDERPVQVKVEVYDHQGQTIDAKLLGTHDSGHDLAVITFPAPQGFRWNAKCLGTNEHQNAPTDVWFVGKSRKWSVPVIAGRISSDEPTDSRIEIEGLSVRPGSSGGPLIASSGIVGMITRDSADNTEALSIGFIKASFRRWNHPFQLEPSAAVPPTTVDDTAEKNAIARFSEEITGTYVLAAGSTVRMDKGHYCEGYPVAPRTPIDDNFRSEAVITRVGGEHLVTIRGVGGQLLPQLTYRLRLLETSSSRARFSAGEATTPMSVDLPCAPKTTLTARSSGELLFVRAGDHITLTGELMFTNDPLPSCETGGCRTIYRDFHELNHLRRLRAP